MASDGGHFSCEGACGHLIPPHLFSDGTQHARDEEMSGWRAYMAAELARSGLEKQPFFARKGDVLIWHAHLLHGGGIIHNPVRTRKPCVFHYYSDADARVSGVGLVPQAGALWLDRAPRPMPRHVAERLPVVEWSYLRRYPDVAAAVAKGLYPSGAAHYAAYGCKEGRLPV